MLSIGLMGFNEHSWQSVERTRNFYLESLKDNFDFEFLSDSEEIPNHIEAVICFAGGKGWGNKSREEVPFFYGIHGGAILDQEFLKENIPNLTNKDTLIVNCSSDVEIISRLISENGPHFLTLPLPVRDDVFFPIDNKECKEVMSIDENTCVLGFVGRLLPQKNLHQFLKMFYEVRSQRRDLNFKALIVGQYWVDYPVLKYDTTENYPEIIPDLISDFKLEDNIIYLDNSLSNEQLNYCYNAIDILIHPTNSLDENFGYVPVEAMACGTPVIGAAYGGLKDTIIDGVTGFTMKTWVTESGIRMDTLTGVNNICKLIENEKLMDEFSLNSIRHIAQNYSLNSCEDILISAIKDRIANSKLNNEKQTKIVSNRRVDHKFNFLPKTSNNYNWEDYYDVVGNYVSNICPGYNDDSFYYTPNRLEIEEQNICKLLDAAWPAEFQINNEERVILEKSHLGFFGYEVKDIVFDHKRVISEMLKKGIIISKN